MLLRRFVVTTCCIVATGCSSSNSTPSPAETFAPIATATATPTAAPTPTAGASSTGAASSVSGDMLAIAPNKGWTYHGYTTDADGNQTIETFTLYADPVEGSTETLVLFDQDGTTSTAFAGSEYGSTPLTVALQAVPSTFVDGSQTSLVPGLIQTVTSVGTVPGESACPAPGNGATVEYSTSLAAAAGTVATISYVPGCGITSIVAPGMSFQLASVGSYPSEGTQLREPQDLASVLIRTVRGAGTVFFRRPSAKTMPDVYDTQRYGQTMADLLGTRARTNGQAFLPSLDLVKLTGGDGAIAFIEKKLAGAKDMGDGSYALASGTRIAGTTYDRYACAFGVSADGSGRLRTGRNVGRLWVTQASRACAVPQNYVALRALAATALSDLSR